MERTDRSAWIDALMATLLAGVLAAAWSVRDWSNLASLRLPDPDDMMRLQQIRDWLGGQAFADLTQYRLGADGVAGPATLAALRRSPPRSILTFAAPLGVTPTDRFGPRGAMFHTGQDYPAPLGTPVGAAGRGCVESVGWIDGYGRVVVIRHRLGMTSWYAHLSRISVPRGRCVVAGDLIGRVGSTGRSTGPHLHLELRLRGAAVDPRTGGL